MMIYRAALLMLLSGCATTEMTVLLGVNHVRSFETDTSFGLSLEVAQRFGKVGICAGQHASNPANGEPFNDRFEITSQFVGCGIRLGGR